MEELEKFIEKLQAQRDEAKKADIMDIAALIEHQILSDVLTELELIVSNMRVKNEGK